jgi:hypothetical protein
LKLLLDEMYSSAIAVQLRRRKHDVIAVTERSELVSLADRTLFARAADEHRALVTNNVVDYIALFHETLQAGREHFGLVFTDDRRLPRTPSGIGALVRSLQTVLIAHPADDALRNQLQWTP